MTALDLAVGFGTALGLGLLLGLERERAEPERVEQFAGARTFALIALVGATAVHLDRQLGLHWLTAVAFLSIAGLVVASHAVSALKGDLGATTEVSGLLTFLIGGLCAAGDKGLATALAVATLLMLALKGWTRRLAAHIEPADVEATLKFAIVTVIVLPLLPDRAFGPPPLDVINPHQVWLMVVLISGLNFASYVLVKLLGREHGIGLTGLLGGLVSSTALTLGFSQRSRHEPALAPAFSLGILLAWALMFFRLLVVVLVVNPSLARRVAAGIVAMGAVALALGALALLRRRAEEKGRVESGSNPFELGEALKFGLLFGAITLVARAAEVYLGPVGLYFAGGLAGLTDADAISLSMANLARSDPAAAGVAARTILIAAVSNTVSKAGIVMSLAAPELRRQMLPAAVLLVATGVVAAVLTG